MFYSYKVELSGMYDKDNTIWNNGTLKSAAFEQGIQGRFFTAKFFI